MTDKIEREVQTRRTTAARLGCVALNLIQPGIGLLRIGAGRAGVLTILAPLIWLVASIGLFALAPSPTFAAIAIYVGSALALVAVLYLFAMVRTWRASTSKLIRPPWWTRWYALVGIAIGGSLASASLVPVAHRFYKPFYIPSESMAPTLGKLDRIVADMRAGRHPAIGDIVLIETGSVIFIKRVAGLPGDRIAIVGDIATINGKTSDVRSEGQIRFLGSGGWEQAKVLQEQFPREAAPHKIALTAPTPYGDMTERTVPPGHVFVLGDNREYTADSRLPTAEGGLGMVPLTDLVGKPLYVTWPHGSGAIGRPADH